MRRVSTALAGVFAGALVMSPALASAGEPDPGLPRHVFGPHPDPEATPLEPLDSLDSPDPAEAPPHQPAEDVAGVPIDGRGMQVGGLVLLGGGATLLTGAGLSLMAPREPPWFWQVRIVAFTAGGLASINGLFLTIFGSYTQHHYRAWARGQAEAPPNRGSGLRASGGILTAAGGTGLLLGGIFFATSAPADYATPGILVGTGAAVTAVGVGLLVVGHRRRQAFERWARNRRPDPGDWPVQVSPIVAPLPDGAAVGVAGRF